MKLKKHKSEDNFEVFNFKEKTKYDVVLIIGNGFDRAFNLKTSYNNFIENKYFKSLLKQENKFAEYLDKKYEYANWIDIENELSTYSIAMKSANDNYHQEFTDLSIGLTKYLNSIDKVSIPVNNLPYNFIKSIIGFKTLIIDFNYTPTISLIISQLYDEVDPERYSFSENITHIKIHGSLKEKNIIFGVDDKAKIYENHIFLKKSVNKSYNPTNFNLILQECNSIGIFGHSLGETDHMYFSKYFQNACVDNSKNSNKNVTLFYFEEEGRLDLHKQLDILTKQSIAKFKQNNEVLFLDSSKINMKLRDDFCEICRINTYKTQIRDKTYNLSIEYIPDNKLWKYSANWRCIEDSTGDKEAFSHYFNMAVVLESKFTNIEKTKNENCHLCKNNLKITKDDDGIL